MESYFKAQSQHGHSMLQLAVELARIRSFFGDAPYNVHPDFPGLQDRVLSKCSDAHIYLDHGTCSPFQRWQSAFVSSGI